MQTTTTYSFGDIVLVPFPFTDQTNRKKRPAAIVSTSAYNAAKPDVIIMAVTSQVKLVQALGECLVSSWRQAGLLKPSAIKPVITRMVQKPCPDTLQVHTTQREDRPSLNRPAA